MKKVSVISLIILFLVSTFGFTINEHYCGGHKSGVSLYLAATCSCGDNEMEANCCENKSQFVHLDEDYIIVAHNLNFNTELFAEMVDLCIELLIESNVTPAHQFTYKPPLIERDIPILVQSFLI